MLVCINWKVRIWMIEVLKPGFYSTIQDLGRLGYREFGVPISGAMDRFSAKMANRLLGNDLNDAVLEVTLTGPSLQFNCSTLICITGANINPNVNKEPVHLNHRISMNSGDILTFGKLESGYRTYIAVRGGFLTPLVMNSRSMYPNITSSSKLTTHDLLHINEDIDASDRSYASIKLKSDHFENANLGAFKGPEFESLPAKLQVELESRMYTVSKNNNRMGYQFVETLKNTIPSILTGPVLPGTVQLTPSGNLILLMRDGQISGGYPRILQLTEEAINVLAQKKVGDPVRFQVKTHGTFANGNRKIES